MTDSTRNYEEEVARIEDELSESTLYMTDEEIVEEMREEGIDPDQVNDRVKDILRETTKHYRQRSLMKAQGLYDNHVAELRLVKGDLPESLDEQRRMIGVVLASNSQFSGGLLTAHFRDFDNLADEDVESYLRQLLKLIEMTQSDDFQDGDD